MEHNLFDQGKLDTWFVGPYMLWFVILGISLCTFDWFPIAGKMTSVSCLVLVVSTIMIAVYTIVVLIINRKVL